MFSRNFMLCALFVVLAALFLDNQAEARYLPTRSNGERVDKLRELLKEVSKMYRLLESEIEKEEMGDMPRWHPDSKLFYKREAKEAQQPLPQQ